jgi:hypothetical protein
VTLDGDGPSWFSFQRVDGDRLIPAAPADALLRAGTYRLIARSTDRFCVCKESCVDPLIIRAMEATAVVVR